MSEDEHTPDIARQAVVREPDNIIRRVELAEMYSECGMVDEAIEQFTRVCDRLRARKLESDFIKVAERLLWHQPDNYELGRELATVYLGRKEPVNALRKLQPCYKAQPGHIDTLSLLARTFEAMSKIDSAVAVLRELAEIYKGRHERGKAAEAYRKILTLVDDDPAALACLEEIEGN